MSTFAEGLLFGMKISNFPSGGSVNSEVFSSHWSKMSAKDRKNSLAQTVGGVDLYIVYLDDEKDILEIVSEKLKEQGFNAFGTTDPVAALDFVKKNRSKIAMVISDFKMPTMDGFAFRQQVQQFASDLPFTILSAYVDREMALRGLELKIAAFLEKPVRDEELQSHLIKECTPRILAIKEELELLRGFTDDAANLIEQVEESVLELEENPHDLESVSKVFGMIHTIKGSSGFFEPRTLHTFAHRLEDSLKEIQSGSKALTPAVISIWLQSCDILKTLIEEFKSGKHTDYDLNDLIKIFNHAPITSDEVSSTPKAGPGNSSADIHSPAAQKQKGPQELKVSVTLLDEFMQISGEMTVIRNMINKIVRSIEKQYPSDKDVSLLGELLGELHKVNGSVQSKITEIRKVPVKSVIKPLGRIIRDTSQVLKKDVEFKMLGEEIRIDTSVAEVLSNSLIHLVRNSMDHGIEGPEERSKAGKIARGELKISTKIYGESILVEIEDDGKGINPDVIRKKLISNGTHTLDQVHRMSVSDLYQMIFSAGFSTAQQITDISGRGVGMSMVKDVVEAIGGRISIDSQLGKGTKFTLDIPIPKSVLITNCLFVTSLNMQFGVPQDQIKRIINVEEAKNRGYIDSLEGAKILRVDEELLPIVSLENVLCGNFKTCPQTFEEGYLVILSASNQSFCLWVDAVWDVEDTVVKAISAGQIKNLGLYTGATFVGDGSIGLILNVEGIAQKTGVGLEQTPKQLLTQNSQEKAENLNSIYTINVVLCELENQGLYAIPQQSIFRLEEFNSKNLQPHGNYIVAPYRNRMITFVDLNEFIQDPSTFNPDLSEARTIPTLVLQHQSGFVGLIVGKVIDLVTTHTPPEHGTTKLPGSNGWLILGERSVMLVNIEELLEIISHSYSEDSLSA